ncbi:outer membrane beta-barrel family protein [Catalinimonas sp. 4WD22]|uniref:outer membrane beta-barrel family protein n=1 Tax=Catalinimonas locisalis TaxID=3133978 RepID=UPI003101B223
MKHYIFLLALMLLSASLTAQGDNTISGKVSEASANEPLPYSSVSVFSVPDSTLVSGVITDEEGLFSIEGLRKGKYSLHFSFVGYQPRNVDVLLGELNTYFDVGTIALEAVSAQLDEVVVEGQREIVSSGLDQKSFNVDNILSQSGGSVLDVMKTMPGVTVDQEGKVILRGSDKVAVLIDGKQSSLTGFGNQKALDNIPAANIERIEIINNPSAKYDASGMAGIINIIYKKEKESGFSGDVGLSLGLGAFSAPPREDLPTELGSFQNNPKAIPSLNLNYRTPKLNYFLQSQVILQEALPNNEFTIRNYSDGRNTISQVPENRRQVHYILNGGVDWNLDDNNTLTFSGIYDFERHVDTAQVAYIDQNAERRYRYYAWNEEEVTGYINLSAQYKHKFESAGHTLDAGLQYTRGWEDETYSLNDSSAVRQGKDKTNILAIEHTTTASIDYVKPLMSGRLEAGAKVRIRRLPVEYAITPGENSIIYPDLGDWSRWGEDLYAAYLNYILEQPFYDIEGGIRAEQTEVFYNLDPANAYYPTNDAYDYFRLFPNIRFTYKINESNRLSAFYNNRVDRTGEPELRVFPKFDDPELLKVGNPYLRPQFTQTFELAYKYLWATGSMYVAGFHRIIEDPFMRIFAIDSSNTDYNIINKTYQNTGGATNTGVELILTQDINEFAKLSGSFNWYNNHIDAYTGTILFPYERPFNINEYDDNTWDFKLNGLFNLPRDIQLQLTGIYYAPKNIPQGEQLSRSSVDLGIKKGMMNGKGELTFSISDMFYNFGIRQDIVEEAFTARYENNYETQVMRLDFNYKF